MDQEQSSGLLMPTIYALLGAAAGVVLGLGIAAFGNVPSKELREQTAAAQREAAEATARLKSLQEQKTTPQKKASTPIDNSPDQWPYVLPAIPPGLADEMQSITACWDAAQRLRTVRREDMSEAEWRQRTLKTGIVIWETRTRRLRVVNFSDGRPREVYWQQLIEGEWRNFGLDVYWVEKDEILINFLDLEGTTICRYWIDQKGGIRKQ